MAVNPFKKATKKNARLRLGLIGPPGSGKTFTALQVATAMAQLQQKEAKIALMDSENHSSEKYADLFAFDVLGLEGSYHPKRYVEGIRAAEGAGYEYLIIDSLSHAWIGKDGGLDLHDQAEARQKVKNSFTAWAEVTPEHRALVNALVQCKCHLIVTLRSKVEYVMETVNGKSVPRKVGTAPLMRDGLEYEFDVVGDMDDSNTLVITKSRCRPLARQIIPQPGGELAATLLAWLTDGAPEEAAPTTPLSNGDGGQHRNGNAARGDALYRRLVQKDSELAKRGVCKLGDLVDHVRRVGDKKGLAQNIAEWSEEGLQLAISAVQDFEARLQESPRTPLREPGEDG